MMEWWNALPLIEQVFYIIAIPSTLILLLQTILLLFGVGGGHDADYDTDTGADVDAGAETDHDHGAAHVAGLRLLTVRGIVAFLAVCGWVGVALTDLGVSAVPTTIAALAGGFAAMLVVALVLRWSLKLQSSGNLNLHNAVGLTVRSTSPSLRAEKARSPWWFRIAFWSWTRFVPSRLCGTANGSG